MKKLIIIFIVWILALWYTMANDCDMVKPYTQWESFGLLENWKYENILPKIAMEQAMINLKNFCCMERILTENSCDDDSRIDDNLSFPSSAYLYDHILDVSMRRLDAKAESDNGADLMYWLEPDKSWKKWRDFITKHANSKDGSIPLQISNEFKEYWEADTHTLQTWKDNSNKIDELDKLWKSELEKYDDWNLINKYMGVCETSLYIYLSTPGDKDIATLKLAYNNCETLSNNRIKKEFDYTKAILMQKWNKLLYNNVKTYLDNYFSQNKLISLQQLVFNIKNTFNEINKAIIGFVDNCS
mgnify:CR=1 FL=1